MEWIEKAKSNLLPHSISQDFNIAKKEWIYLGVDDNETSECDCQLCNHSNIRYEYSIYNSNTNSTLKIGSSCIKQFIKNFEDTNDNFLDERKNIVTEKRIEDDTKHYELELLKIILNKKFETYNNDFYRSLINQIISNQKVTINQCKYLQDLYYNSNLKEQKLLKKYIKITLKKKRYKDQYYYLNDDDKKFINIFLSSSQKNIFK